jgi:hypothetical protein
MPALTPGPPLRARRRFAATVFIVLVLGSCSPNLTPPRSPAALAADPWPSPLALPEIRAEITRRAGDRLLEIGDGAGAIIVGLRATEEGLARGIVDAYGAAVSVHVGWLPFPPVVNARNPCVGGRELGNHPSLRAAVDMRDPIVRSGENFEATVRINNVATIPIVLDTSSNFDIYLFDPSMLGTVGETPIGATQGMSVGTGWSATLQPGQWIDLPGHGGTASCEIARGYVVAPGRYAARALIDFVPELGAQPVVFWSEPITIDVVAP